MAKIGILGGTFNPIHLGHLLLAENAYDQLQLDKVLIMPTGISYLKEQSEVLPAKIRARMTEIAIEDNSHFEVSYIEINKEGNSYTADTLYSLKKEYPNDSLYFICGEDSLYGIDTWVRPQDIFDNCILVVAKRTLSDNDTYDKMNETAGYLKRKYNAKIVFLNTPNMEISSSDIRNRLAHNQSVKYYLPNKLIEYIKDSKYYNK